MIVDPIDWWPLSGLTTSILVIFPTIYLLLRSHSLQKCHPNEPPIIPSPIPIPYIGHLLGMLFQGGHYVKTLGIQNLDRPIFTLVVPFSRMYIVTDPVLAAAIQRKPPRQLSFSPLLPELTQRVLGLDNATKAIVARNLDPELGEERGFIADLHDMVYSHLGPGSEVEELTLQAVRVLAGELDRYADFIMSLSNIVSGRLPQEGLLHWTRHMVTTATAALLYGERNPIAAHPELDLESAFWEFDHGLGRLLMNVVPSITARKAFLGREKLVRAFMEYLEAGHFETSDGEGASQIVRNRVHMLREHGFSLDGMARSELSFLFAGIVNTATTTFWTTLRIFADRKLLATVREELLSGGAVNAHAIDGHRTLSVGALTRDNYAACPTLYSAYREVLRLGSNNFSNRLVQADTTVAASGHHGDFFLRRGGMVQISSGVMHADRSIWGDDADGFDPGRYLDKERAGGGKDNAVHPAAFRPFGGGKTMCPGRHFATGEIMSLVALIVLRFELEGVNDEGESRIRVPKLDDRILPVHILEPDATDPITVRVALRDGGEGGKMEVVP